MKTEVREVQTPQKRPDRGASRTIQWKRERTQEENQGCSVSWLWQSEGGEGGEGRGGGRGLVSHQLRLKGTGTPTHRRPVGR